MKNRDKNKNPIDEPKQSMNEATIKKKCQKIMIDKTTHYTTEEIIHESRIKYWKWTKREEREIKLTIELRVWRIGHDVNMRVKQKAKDVNFLFFFFFLYFVNEYFIPFQWRLLSAKRTMERPKRNTFVNNSLVFDTKLMQLSNRMQLFIQR